MTLKEPLEQYIMKCFLQYGRPLIVRKIERHLPNGEISPLPIKIISFHRHDADAPLGGLNYETELEPCSFDVLNRAKKHSLLAFIFEHPQHFRPI